MPLIFNKFFHFLQSDTNFNYSEIYYKIYYPEKYERIMSEGWFIFRKQFCIVYYY